MAKGDIMNTGDLVVEEGLCKTDVALVVGDVVVFDTDGWVQAGTTSMAPYGVNLTAVTVSSGQVPVRIVRRGVVIVAKDNSNALVIGQRVKPIAAGEVDLWVVPDWPASFNEAQCQAEVDKLVQIVGVEVESVASGVLFIKIRMGAW